MTDQIDMDAVFNHVKTAMELLDDKYEFYDPQKARRILHMIMPMLALATLQVTKGSIGSEHMQNLTNAINNPFSWEKENQRHDSEK